MSKRLLCAAYQTYAIHGPGEVNTYPGDAVPASLLANYLKAPKAFVAGPIWQDAAFVASFQEGVVIAVRGTTPSYRGQSAARFIADWMGNVAITLAPSGVPPGFPGHVHPGFKDAFARLSDAGLMSAIDQAVAAHAEQHPGLARKIFLTGHSKGGAICPLIAYALRQKYDDHEIVVRTFAAARIGDQVFATAYRDARIDHIRYEYDEDMVPHLPVATALAGPILPPPWGALVAAADPGYGEVGRLGYIDTLGNLSMEGATPAPPSASHRMAKIGQRLDDLLNGPGYILSCHDISKSSSGYARGAYTS